MWPPPGLLSFKHLLQMKDTKYLTGRDGKSWRYYVAWVGVLFIAPIWAVLLFFGWIGVFSIRASSFIVNTFRKWNL